MLTEKDVLNAEFKLFKDDRAMYEVEILVAERKLWFTVSFESKQIILFDHMLNSPGPGEHDSYTILDVEFSKKGVNSAYKMLTGKDLDFSPKKDYSWEGVFSAMSVEQYKMCVEFFYSLLHFDLLTKKEKESIEAGFKLRIIIKEINEDFPASNEYTYYPFIDINHKIGLKRCLFIFNNIGCASLDGFSKLVDTNTPLLKQYFGRKWKANT